jgi:hypothetical protein
LWRTEMNAKVFLSDDFIAAVERFVS